MLCCLPLLPLLHLALLLNKSLVRPLHVVVNET
jgi:hypothetical protein